MKFRSLIAASAALGVVLGTAGVALAAPTGGSGGAFEDRPDKQSFSANGITSTYQIFAEGLDTSKEIGALIWADGSGGYGIDNPNQTYLTDADGANGMRQVARDNNMVLLIPEAPAPSCDGADNCWYNTSGSPTPSQKAAWSKALIDDVYSKYNIEKDRVALGGYSSGAQWLTRWFVPLFGDDVQTDGVFVPVAFGGAPAVTASFTQSYKDNVVGVWNTGTSDSAYSTSSWGAIAGHNWYRDQGFTVEGHWPSGVGHSRGGEFDDIMRDAINRHVRAAQPVGSTPTEPTEPTEPTDPATTSVGPDAFAYTGTWNTVTSPAERWSNTAGDTATIQAEIGAGGGTVSLRAIRDLWQGEVGISVDGGPETLINQYANPRQADVAYWTSPQLAEGSHTIRVRVTGVAHSSGLDDVGSITGASTTNGTLSAPSTTPTEPEVPAEWATSVEPTRTGGTFTTNVPDGYSGRLYVRLSSGNYLYENVTGPSVVSQTFKSQQCGRTMTWTVEAPSGTPRASGTFSTLPC